MTHNANNRFREPSEYAPIEESYNPSIHRINHAVKNRAIHPDGSVPNIPPILLQFSSPPEDLLAKNKDAIEALIEASDVKKGKLETPPINSHISC
jgi:ATP-dependent DNA helicase 2 subunit 2